MVAVPQQTPLQAATTRNQDPARIMDVAGTVMNVELALRETKNRDSFLPKINCLFIKGLPSTCIA